MCTLYTHLHTEIMIPNFVICYWTIFCNWGWVRVNAIKKVDEITSIDEIPLNLKHNIHTMYAFLVLCANAQFVKTENAALFRAHTHFFISYHIQTHIHTSTYVSSYLFCVNSFTFYIFYLVWCARDASNFRWCHKINEIRIPK